MNRLGACDPDPKRLEYAAAEFGAECFSAIEDGLAEFHPDVVLVCTPPVCHVAQAIQALRAGAQVFIEKPLSDRVVGLEELREEASMRGATVQVGYNLRFHPGIQTLKRLLEEGTAGRILWARAEVAQYLPDWRPWQDYRESYTSRRELGGGIILDASHEIDLMLWLLGPPRELTCMAGRVSELDVTVEDCATIVMRLQSGAQADIHMDFVQRTATRSCVLAGEHAGLEWDYARTEVRILRPEVAPEFIKFEFEANQMYLAELEYFLSRVNRGETNNQTLADAELTLRVALAALRSAAEKKWVSFDE